MCPDYTLQTLETHEVMGHYHLMKRRRMRDEHKEKVREQLSLAPIRTIDVAKETGIRPGNLYNFISSGHLGPEDVHILDKYLKQKGYAKEDHAPYGTQLITCRACEKETPSTINGSPALYCAYCRAPLGIPCTNCKTRNDDDARFCKLCGQPIDRQPQATSQRRAPRRTA